MRTICNLALALIFSACSTDHATPPLDAGATPLLSASTPTPRVAPGDDLKLALTMTNFKPDLSGKGDGYYDLHWDDSEEPLVQGDTPTITITVPDDATHERHTILVALRDNGGRQLVPAVEATVAIQVAPATMPEGSISLHADQTTVEVGRIFTFDFDFVGWPWGDAEPGDSVLFLDDTIVIHSVPFGRSQLEIPWSTSLGKHLLTVGLRDSHGDPLSPPVEATLQFDVTAYTGPTLSLTADKTTVTAGGTVTLTLDIRGFRAALDGTGDGSYEIWLMEPARDDMGEPSIGMLASGDAATITVTIPNDAVPNCFCPIVQNLMANLVDNAGTPLSPGVEDGTCICVDPAP